MSPTVPAFPDPASPEGQAWAAAGFPLGTDGSPAVPAVPPAAPAEPPAVASLAGYTYHDQYADPPRDRTQVILITAHEDDGAGGTRVRGFALGFADDAASFAPGQLD